MNLQSHSLELPKSHFHKLQILNFLKREQKELLLKFGQLLSMSKKMTLFSDGDLADNFFIVLAGSIKLTKSYTNKIDTDKCIVDIVHPGEIIASILMLTEKREVLYPISAISTCKSEVLILSKDFYHQYWKKDPLLLNFSQQQMITRVQKLQLSQSIQRLSTEKKLAFILTELFPENSPIILTRSELSDYAGTTTESVIRILSRWSQQGLIISESKKIQILSKSALQQVWWPPELLPSPFGRGN